MSIYSHTLPPQLFVHRNLLQSSDEIESVFLYGLCDAVLLVGPDRRFGRPLQLRPGVAHGDARADHSDHLEVVTAVTDREYSRGWHIEATEELSEPLALAPSCG